MTSKNYEWLSHLENSLPKSVQGYTSGLYSIALEGWRRGLNLKFINIQKNKANTVIKLSDGEKVHRFRGAMGDLITRQAMRVCANKSKTKEYLLKNNVPTPIGKSFSKHTDYDTITKYALGQGFPLVIKPRSGQGGKGVIAGIKNEDQFREALIYVREKLGYNNIIVEDHFDGEDYRVYVVGDKVVAITKRTPANVIGDGNSTIQQLIKEKNEQRRKSPILGASLIRIDEELHNMLKEYEYGLHSIPSIGERIYLKSKNNISAGGDPVDITDEVSDSIKQIAVDACKAIPGLPHAGVDLMVNTDNNTAVVLEINSRPSIRTHLFPMEGKARDVPKELIDYYFPETQANHDCPLYFDYGPIWEQFRQNSAQEITIPNLPKGEIELTRFIISGKVRRVGYARWVRRQARDLRVHGYVKHLRNQKVSIVVCGAKKQVDKFREIINTQNSRDSVVKNVVEKERTTPVPIGFKIKNAKYDRRVKDGYNPVRLKDPERRKKSKRNKTQDIRSKQKSKNKINYKKEYEKVINSTSWKITRPLRLLGKILKR